MDHEDHICKNCAYFRQHYVKLGWSYREIKFGHCVYPRLKIREAGAKACTHYKQREHTTSATT